MSFPEFSGLPTDDDAIDASAQKAADAVSLPDQNAPSGPVPSDDEYVIVKTRDGFEKMSRADFDAAISAQNTTPSAAPDKPAEEEEFYVHLANGDVERVKRSELPGPAGTNAVYGYLIKDDAAHHIVGVYPAERKVNR